MLPVDNSGCVEGIGGVRVLEGWNDDQTDIATDRVKLNGARATRGGYEAAGES
jgi:hypothetical protein